MEEFVQGDVVRLNSGGPKMTVLQVEEGIAHCQWFDAKHKADQGAYPVAMLTKDDPTAGWGAV